MRETSSVVPTTPSSAKQASMQSSVAYTVVGEVIHNKRYNAWHNKGSVVPGVVACMGYGVVSGVHVAACGVVGGAR